MVALWQMMDWKGFGRKQAPLQHLSEENQKNSVRITTLSIS